MLGQEKWKDLIIPYYQNIKIVPYESVKMERNTMCSLSHHSSLGDFWVKKSNHNLYTSFKVLIWTLQNTRKIKHFLKRVYKPRLNFWSLDWLCMLSEFKTVNKDIEFWWLVYTRGEGKHVSSLCCVVDVRKHMWFLREVAFRFRTTDRSQGTTCPVLSVLNQWTAWTVCYALRCVCSRLFETIEVLLSEV